jgi:hypothetical protein
MVVYPDVQILDVTGPLEVFGRTARWLVDQGRCRQPAYIVELLAAPPGIVRSSSGLELVVRRSFTEVRRGIDTLLVAGGISWSPCRVSKGPVKLLHLLAHKVEHVWARAAARPLDLDDLLDLVEVEAQPPRLGDEGEECERLLTVHAVAHLGAPRWRENPGLLVEPKRLPANPGPPGHITDEQAVRSHAGSVNPVPRGKVKRICSWPARYPSALSVTPLDPVHPRDLARRTFSIMAGSAR